jgi:electron transport complex protein RnfC
MITGGLRLTANKARSTATPINRRFTPTRLIIPMLQQLGSPALPIVEVDQRVLRGESIAEPGAPPSAAVHASTSGMITAIEERLVPSGSRLVRSRCVILEPDGRDESIRTDPGHWPLGRQARLDAIRAAGLVGLGGAVFPAAEKLAIEGSCQTLILNGAECEPYISCDDMLMREHAGEIVRGALAMMEILGAQLGIVAIERDKPEAVLAIRGAMTSADDARLRLAEVPAIYPAGGERQLVEILTGQEVPGDAYPIDIGCLCHNVGTAYALDRLIMTGEPLITRIVTVTGLGVATPQNVVVPIGAPIDGLIRFCGGYREGAARLILGGSMMGYALPTDELPVTKATNCVIAARDSEIRTSYAEWPCIQCGDCIGACPVRLLPHELLRSARTKDFEMLDGLGLTDCIECGCCDVVCPSQIPLTQHFRQAKRDRALDERRERFAIESQERHRRRQERLHLQAHTMESAHAELKRAIRSDEETKKDLIEAAVRRSRRRHDEPRNR